MKFTPSQIPDVIIIAPQVFEDSRGFFFESYHRDKFASHGLDIDIVQENMSRSSKGTLRGLHYQLNPHAQGKLVRVTQGRVFDVAVDIRPKSPTFKQWIGRELNDTNREMLYVPPGFAHGFYVLSEQAEFCYLCTAAYNQSAERAIHWQDPALNIQWPLDTPPLLSDKDSTAPNLAEAEVNYN